MYDINKQVNKFKRIIDERDLIEVNIIRVANQGKQSLRFIVKELLRKQGAEHMGEDVFSSLIELIFNAIKANYKFLFAREEIKRLLKNEGLEDIKSGIDKISRDEDLLSKYIAKIDMKEVRRKVRATLSEEESVTKIKDDAKNENRELTTEEKKKINDALKVARLAQKENIKVYLRISSDEESIIIDVINTAPIFPKDLQRIKEKRESFRKYKEKGEEHNFYIENIDETESAGFGAAMIDARLYALDIIPTQHYDIWGYKDKTAVTITFPIKKVTKNADEPAEKSSNEDNINKKNENQ